MPPKGQGENHLEEMTRTISSLLAVSIRSLSLGQKLVTSKIKDCALAKTLSNTFLKRSEVNSETADGADSASAARLAKFWSLAF